ncbi:hypothetical protein [Sulfurimonas sp.]|uniref:hypothetical protein n=1 Tax=Sulfurimonas sp. TaxID=2022749 RepID=UPI002AB1FDC2|nr:hypothetical protein [Sulfurimonas sp.]
MQRSIINQNPLAPFAYVILFIAYESLSSIYLFLPPLFAVLFVFFINAIKKEDSLEIFLVSFCLIVYESQMGFPLFSSIIYFGLIYKFVMPKLKKNFDCKSCIKVASVVLSYFGFYLFLVLLSNIFLLPMPSMNYYMLYYIIIEFFIVSIL